MASPITVLLKVLLNVIKVVIALLDSGDTEGALQQLKNLESSIENGIEENKE